MQTALASNWAISEPNVIALTQRLDSGATPDFIENAQANLLNGSREMVLDCASLTYISSAGLHALLTLAKDVQKLHGKLALCNLQGQPQEMISACGFDQIIQVYADQDEALASLAA